MVIKLPLGLKSGHAKTERGVTLCREKSGHAKRERERERETQHHCVDFPCVDVCVRVCISYMCGERERQTDRDREREASRYVERKAVTLREREREKGLTRCRDRDAMEASRM